MNGTSVLLGQMLTVFGIVVAGTWAATQWTAAHLGYQLRLGSPWFDCLGVPFYHPWRLFEWWYWYDAYAPRLFLKGGAIAATSGVAAAFVAIGMSVWRARQSRLVTTYGSARWADARDIRKAGLTQPIGVFLGLHDGQYLRHEGPEHVLTFAPTRSGKGVGLVVPTLLSWPASAVISTRRYRINVPEVPFHLDALLADSALIGGLAPMLGDQHLRVVTVRGFPTSTWPGLLDDLNRLGFAYRWSTRFLCLDKAEAEKELTRLRRQWFAKRKNVIALLRETIFQQESPLVDTDASNKAMDADAALQELGSDQVAFGYVTATVTVMDADAAAADEKLRRIERAIQGRGFVTIPETLNAVEAWLSSIPGHAYANVRQPSISTLNLAHLMPLSAVWAGPEKNKHLDGPPLIVTRTDGDTPFRLVTHIGDVGHTLVVGPTGMGKSVLLATLAMQFRRYRGSRIFAFDMGRSMRATILGLGGEHYDLGADGAIAFQPLARIDRENYRTWAAEWAEGRLLHEGITIGPDEKAAVWSALGSLAGAPIEQRTLTGLSVLLQSNALRQALAPYVLGGAHGRLLDADHDRLGSADVQSFEMEELMPTRAAVLAVLGYLFARFDERFDGAPTLLILDESWLFLDDPIFAARIRQWLKTLRKKNVSVIFATQSLADIKDSSIAPAIIESCASRIFLPNPQATEPQIRTIYEGFGLNSRQIEIVATAEPKRDYYYQSRLGNRLFDLDLGPATLAFAGASTPQDQRDIDRVLLNAGTPGFAGAWLRHSGLDWAADLMPSFLTSTEIQP